MNQRPVWQTSGWKEAVMEIIDPGEKMSTREVLKIVDAIADITHKLATPLDAAEEDE